MLVFESQNPQKMHASADAGDLLCVIKTEITNCSVDLETVSDVTHGNDGDADSPAEYTPGEKSPSLKQPSPVAADAGQEAGPEADPRGSKSSPWDKIKMPRNVPSPSSQHGRKQAGGELKKVFGDARKSIVSGGVAFPALGEAPCDSNWVDKEIVVTDVTLNSEGEEDVVTFVECRTKEGFFSSTPAVERAQ